MENNALNELRIDAPCQADWNVMLGDERTRHCAACRKNVHDLSRMTAVEAAELVSRAEGSLCVRMLVREDGTMVNREANVARRARAVRRLARLAAALLIPLGLLSGCKRGDAMLGRVAAQSTSSSSPPPVRMMGEVAVPTMGKIALPLTTRPNSEQYMMGGASVDPRLQQAATANDDVKRGSSTESK